MQTAAEIREWMKRVMEEQSLTPATWAHRAKVAKSTINRALREDYQFVTSRRTLAQLAQAVGVTPPTIEGPELIREQPTFLAVRYEVGAGLWRRVEELGPVDQEYPVASDPAYSRFPQWLERQLGDSMNLEYPGDGWLFHVVDAIEMGYAPRPGDHVIVERTRGGGDHERTIKEVAYGPKGLMLIARSANPIWASHPIVLAEDGVHDEDHAEVRIVGLVLGAYRSRR